MNVEQLLKTKGGEVTIIGPEKTIGATARLLAERNKSLALVCDASDKLLGVVSVTTTNLAPRCREREPSTPSALGQTRKSMTAPKMSAFGGKAEVDFKRPDFRF